MCQIGIPTGFPETQSSTLKMRAIGGTFPIGMALLSLLGPAGLVWSSSAVFPTCFTPDVILDVMDLKLICQHHREQAHLILSWIQTSLSTSVQHQSRVPAQLGFSVLHFARASELQHSTRSCRLLGSVRTQGADIAVCHC